MYEPPQLETPMRVMFFAACRESWYAASDEERESSALPILKTVLDRWQESGLRLIASFDDDYFLVGQPGSLQHSIFILMETDSVETVVAALNLLRTTIDGLRADKYYRFEARLGRKLFLLGS